MDDLISRQAAIDAVHKNYDVILDFTSDGQTISSSIEDILSDLPSAQPVDEAYLIDWYISSVDDSDPVWTEAHIEELMNDFYLIPRGCIDG